MSINPTIDGLQKQIAALQRQLETAKEDRDRWQRQTLELRRQAKEWESALRATVEQMRREAADHAQRIASIERHCAELKGSMLRRQMLPARRVRYSPSTAKP